MEPSEDPDVFRLKPPLVSAEKMWKFRRGCSLLLNNSLVLGLSTNLNSSYFGRTQGKRSIINISLNRTTENLRCPFYYSCQIPVLYSTSLVYSTADTIVTKLTSPDVHDGPDASDCEYIEHDDSSWDDDEIESKQPGVRNEKFNDDVAVILGSLRSIGSKGNLPEFEHSASEMPVISGADVTNKLNQCGVTVTSELVVEVLSRTRNDWEVAFTFFLWAGKHTGYAPIVREYHSMISILAKRRKFDTAWSLIDEMRQRGIVNPNTLLIMIRRYCAVHDIASAINTFHAFKRFNFHLGIEEFHKLLSALTRYKNVQDAEHLLFSNQNTYPFNTKSFNIILNGWCNVIGSPREANRFWRLMIDQGIKLDVVSYSSIISSCTKSNRLKEVLRLFEKMKEMNIDPDRKVYNAVIHALAKGGHAKEAFNLLRTMQDKGITPNAATYNSLIKPLCKARKRDEARSLFGEMLNQGLRPTIRTLHAFLHIQRTEEEIFRLLDKMKELGCHPNKDTYLLLIRKFCRWQQLDNVFKLWNEMAENGWNDDEASYITLIHGLFLNGNLEEAHKIYSEMKEKSLLPDPKTNELIQTWLSNKQTAESPTTSESGLLNTGRVS